MHSAITASRATALRKMPRARNGTLDELARTGISLDAVTDQLVEDGVRLFADAADKLLAAVAKKRTEILDQQHRRAETRSRPPA